MRSELVTIALLAVMAAPVAAQDSTDPSVMTCGEFLALDPDARMAAMLGLRAFVSGETITETEKVDDATVLTGATEAGATGGMEPGLQSMPYVDDTPEARQRLAGMRTACEGVPEVSAVDALIAAHADYDPIMDEDPVAD